MNAATAEYFEAKFFMANKLVLFSAGAVVIAAAVYAGGVYYTGVKVNEYLSGIENNETISKQLSYYLPGSNLSCKGLMISELMSAMRGTGQSMSSLISVP